MPTPFLLHQMIFASAERFAGSAALTSAGRSASYGELASSVDACGSGLLALELKRSQRVAVYLDKRLETVISCFGACAAGGVFVPVNPVLKPQQVAHILRDCNAQILITSAQRAEALHSVLPSCSQLRHIVLVDATGDLLESEVPAHLTFHRWSAVLSAPPARADVALDTDMAAILYTSGSTGSPKGVVLSHSNIVAGAKSVAQYLENGRQDTLLAVLPLSFDAGFSQLTTAFHCGARAVLLNYLFPRDVLKSVVAERVTGITAVPPLWIQLAELEWPQTVSDHLRYFANTGGHMPRSTLNSLRAKLPRAKPYLMYGLTEAFRATYLPPEQIDKRPDSIGKEIPNTEVLVLRDDGTACEPGETGELVQRGALVGLGYWNDLERTAERFKALPAQCECRDPGLVLPEIAVFSGDLVRKDEEGFLYFVGRRDEMIKTSGYRVSPTEVEELLYATDLIAECVAFGVPDDVFGQAICVVVTAKDGAELDENILRTECQLRMPLYMVPKYIAYSEAALPRNQNGKIDRKAVAAAWHARHPEVAAMERL